jgi:hypothetical protein
MKYFAIRTVRNGMVKINGKYFKPERDCTPLEGQRFAFALYWTGKVQSPFVALWGTLEEYHTSDIEKDFQQPYCVDGVYVWMWWDQV